MSCLRDQLQVTCMCRIWSTKCGALSMRAACAAAGVLFRAYPGPWQVLVRDRRYPDQTRVVHTQDTPPTLREVALDILPNAAR